MIKANPREIFSEAETVYKTWMEIQSVSNMHFPKSVKFTITVGAADMISPFQLTRATLSANSVCNECRFNIHSLEGNICCLVLGRPGAITG